ncbi:MAG: CHASE4 domain-containing protein [bacterium]|nr:CHASE4 domain-containing protein [bacterium]
MTIRSKTFLIFFAALGGSTAIILAASRFILLPSFFILEEQRLLRNVARVRGIVEREVEALDYITRDWAWWDEAWRFVADRNETFIRHNLNDTTLGALNLDALLFINAEGRIVFETGFDRAEGTMAPLPDGMREYVLARPGLARHDDLRGGTAGIATVGGQTILIASRPILTGEGKGPIRGALVAARGLDERKVEEIAALAQASVAAVPPESIREGDAGVDEPAVLVGGGMIAASFPLRDIDGAPALVLRVDQPTELYAQGRTAVLYFIGALLAAGLAFGAVMALAVERTVLRRLRRLSARMNRIAGTGDLSARVVLRGSDEIARLAGSFNGMLVALEQSRLRLEGSEKNYRLLFENMFAGFAYHEIVVDDRGEPVDFIFLEMNDVFERLTGLRRETTVGRRASEVMPGLARDSIDWLDLYGRVALTGETASVERFSEHLGRWYSLAAYSPRHRQFAVIFEDITERKRMEQALRETERRQKAILDNIPDIAWLKDTESRFIAVNEPFGRACGLSPEEMVGKTDFDVWPRALAERYRADDAEVRRSGRRKRVEEPLVDAAGRETWIETIKTPILDDRGRVIGTTGIARDITERKRAAERLEHLTTVLRAIRAVDLLVTRERDPLRLIRGACDNLVRHRGYRNAWIALFDERGRVRAAAESGIGEGFAALARRLEAGDLPPCARRAIETAAVQVEVPPLGCLDCPLAAPCHEGGAMAVRIETGGRVYGVMSVAAAPDPAADEEECNLFSEVARDIGFALHGIEIEEARVRAEEALRRTAENLKRSNEDLEQFAYLASHDLQEPLRMVASYLRLLERRYAERLDGAAAEFIDFAVDGATRMKTLIDDILEYSRVGTSERPFEPTPVGEALDEALGNLQVALRESGASVTRDRLPTVRADRKQLVQLLQNLIANAIRFRGEDPPAVHVSASRKGREWVVSVADNGIGIDPKYAERIFAVFQRLHGRGEYPGTGIGLALCRKIVERHGGRIWVESEPGRGATFRFTLPAGTGAGGGRAGGRR